MPAEHETIHEEIREQTRKFRQMTPRQKVSYFWSYYKVPALVVLLIVAAAFFFTRDYLENSKETLLYAALPGANTLNDYEPLCAAFADYAGIDLTKNHVVFDASIQPGSTDPMQVASTQKMTALAASGSLDAILAREDDFASYARSGFFCDLRTTLPEEMLEEYADSFYYYTFDPAAEEEAALASGLSAEDARRLAGELGPYHTDQPVPVGIRLTDPHGLPADTFRSGDALVLGVCAGSSHVEQALLLLRFLART